MKEKRIPCWLPDEKSANIDIQLEREVWDCSWRKNKGVASFKFRCTHPDAKKSVIASQAGKGYYKFCPPLIEYTKRKK